MFIYQCLLLKSHCFSKNLKQICHLFVVKFGSSPVFQISTICRFFDLLPKPSQKFLLIIHFSPWVFVMFLWTLPPGILRNHQGSPRRNPPGRTSQSPCCAAWSSLWDAPAAPAGVAHAPDLPVPRRARWCLWDMVLHGAGRFTYIWVIFDGNIHLHLIIWVILFMANVGKYARHGASGDGMDPRLR